MDKRRWPDLRRDLEEVFAQRTRDEWAERFEGTDACVAPVLDWQEAREHPHARVRKAYFEAAGTPQAAPAPRFSGTVSSMPEPASATGADTDTILGELGYDSSMIECLKREGVLA